MPSYTIDDQIRARVEQFVAELTDLVRQSALEAVGDALGSAGVAAPARRGRPAGRKKAARKAAGRRGRRSAGDLEAAASTILAHVSANPGQRLEEIGAALGEDTKGLKQPIAMLIADGKLKKAGKARGTTYSAGSGGGGAKRRRKKTAARK